MIISRIEYDINDPERLKSSEKIVQQARVAAHHLFNQVEIGQTLPFKPAEIGITVSLLGAYGIRKSPQYTETLSRLQHPEDYLPLLGRFQRKSDERNYGDMEWAAKKLEEQAQQQAQYLRALQVARNLRFYEMLANMVTFIHSNNQLSEQEKYQRTMEYLEKLRSQEAK